MKDLVLPVYAKQVEHNPEARTGSVHVDSAHAYRIWLKALQVEEVDQYWLETAYQCMKKAIHACLIGTALDPNAADGFVEIRFSNAPEYALTQFPEGLGVTVALREAKGHYAQACARMS